MKIDYNTRKDGWLWSVIDAFVYYGHYVANRNKRI